MNYYYFYHDTTAGVIGCLFIIILCVILGAFSGLIFMLLWNWLAPLFWTSAPHLSFLQAWGVMIVVNWIASLFRNKSK